MRLPIPPFAYPLFACFLVGWGFAWFGRFPLWGLSSHLFFGLLFWGTVLAGIGIMVWLYFSQRKPS